MKTVKLKFNKLLKAKSFKLKADKGFSLLESLVAITVLMVGVSSAIAVLVQSVGLSSKVKNRVIAAHLAQEGIELVRNIRDNNWMAANPWNAGLNEGVAGTVLSGCVEYNSDVFNVSCTSFKMKFDGAYYIHTPDASAVFSREVKITKTSDIEMKIESTVTCGQNCSITLGDHLFDWK